MSLSADRLAASARASVPERADLEASGLERVEAEALLAAVGADALRIEPVDASGSVSEDETGARTRCALEPADEAALARALAACSAHRLPVRVRGGGSRSAYGNPPRAVRLVLSTRALAGIVELDAAEGVLCARAGTPLAALRTALADTPWDLPLDPPGAGSTLGGTLATAAVGPRHTGWGRPRDLVLGLDVVLGDGLRARCGGRVVKNVTGYDLMKLHVGALGTLGVIASAWIRLRPRAEAERVCSAALEPGPGAWTHALAAARLPTVRAAALVDRELAAALEPSRAAGAGPLLLVELAGDEAAVAADALALAESCGAGDASPGALGRLRTLQGESFGPVGLRFRIAALPARMGAVAARLAEAGAGCVGHPATGLLLARFAPDAEADASALDRAWRAARSAAREGGGFAVLEAAPARVRAAADVFGDAPEEIGLWRAVKSRFDPAGVLNPGCFAGRL